jgi:hypothetical protein
VDEDVMHRINKTENLEYAVKFPEETGGGYVAGLEMFHQMHCVVSEMKHYFENSRLIWTTELFEAIHLPRVL